MGSGLRRICAAGAVLLAFMLPAIAGATHRPGHDQPGGGNQDGRVSISASPTVVTFGSPTRISGKLTGNPNSSVAVELQGNPHPFAGGFRQIATSATDSNGDYAFTHRPAEHTRYRVVASTNPRVTSDDVLVRVRIRVTRSVSDRTPRRGALVTFRGSAYPEHDGALVYIKRRNRDGTFRTLARTRLRDAGSERSSYSRRVRVRRSGTYRVRVAGDANHFSGNSRTITISVH